jgi:hypothetical protein
MALRTATVATFPKPVLTLVLELELELVALTYEYPARRIRKTTLVGVGAGVGAAVGEDVGAAVGEDVGTVVLAPVSRLLLTLLALLLLLLSRSLAARFWFTIPQPSQVVTVTVSLLTVRADGDWGPNPTTAYSTPGKTVVVVDEVVPSTQIRRTAGAFGPVPDAPVRLDTTVAYAVVTSGSEAVHVASIQC